MVTGLMPERRRKPMSAGWLLLAGLALAVIVFATLCPMPLRPRLFENPDLERFAAFAALGLAAKLAVPRRHVWTILGLGVVAAVLEAGQRLVPGRDAHLWDAEVKMLGAAAGVQLGLVSLIVQRGLAATRLRPVQARRLIGRRT